MPQLQAIESGVEVLGPASDGLIPAVFIAAGESLNKRFYPPNVLSQAVEKFTGAPIYVDHPSLTEQFERPERSLRDLAGVIVASEFGNFTLRDGSVVAAVGGKIRMASQASWLRDMIDEGIAGDMSIVAYLEGDEDEEGVFQVEEFQRLMSVDFVTTAGAKGQVLGESHALEVDEAPEEGILFIDHELGQALQVESAGSLSVLVSESFLETAPDEGPPGALPSNVGRDQVPVEEEPTEEEPEDTPPAEEEPTDEPSEITLETVHEAVMHLTGLFEAAYETVEDMIASGAVNFTEEPPTEEPPSEDPPEEDNSFEEIVHTHIVSLFDRDLHKSSLERVAQLVALKGLESAAVQTLEGGANQGQTLALVTEQVEELFNEEIQFLQEVAPAQVHGLGSSQPTVNEAEPADVDGVLSKYRMIDGVPASAETDPTRSENQ